MNDSLDEEPGPNDRFDRWRRRAGLGLAPIVFLVLWWVPLTGLAENAHRLLAVFGLVVTLWLTEAIPLAVTALLGPTLCVVCGIGTDKEMFKSFGHPIVFLFLGSFLLAEAMLHHGLNRRIAFRILSLRWVGRSPARILWAFGGITGFLSMWMSNTTAAAMMLPIGIAILSEMARRQSEREGRAIRFADLKYGTGLMLAVAFAASIGGLATPVGTPPNLIAIGFIEKSQGLKITFFQWMAFGVPLAAVMLGFLGLYLNRACPAEPGLLEGSAAWIQTERAKLGPLARGERNVLIAFGVTVILWLLPGVVAVIAGVNAPFFKALERHLPEAGAALLGATLLFVLPVDFRRGEFTIGWAQARRIDWGTILLFGGGLAACLGASLAFMLPVSTPPNAIVFGTGCVPLLKMVKFGIVLDVIGIAAIILVVHWLVPLLLG